MFLAAICLTRPTRGHFIFRRVVPKDLYEVFGRRGEVRLSLRTSDRQLARERWLVHSARWHTLVRYLRNEIAMGKKPKIEGSPDALREILGDDDRMMGWGIQSAPDNPNVTIITAEPHEYETVAKALLGMSGQSIAGSLGVRPSLKLSALIAEFMEELNRQALASQTKEAYGASLALFQEVLGDIELRDLTKERLYHCKSDMLLLPPNRNKSPESRNLDMAELLQRQKNLRDTKGLLKVMTNRTFNNHWGRLSAMLRWAVDNGRHSANLAAGMELADKRKGKTRSSFDSEDLQTIFQSEHFVPGGYRFASEYWVPVLAVHTGARVGEIAQLLIVDIATEGGTPYIDINDDGDPAKSIKNEASRRRVPIHTVIRDSFSAFVEAQRRSGEKRLFPDLSWGHKNGPGRQSSRYFNDRVLPKLGIDGRQYLTISKFSPADCDQLIQHSIRIIVSEPIGRSASVPERG